MTDLATSCCGVRLYRHSVVAHTQSCQQNVALVRRKVCSKSFAVSNLPQPRRRAVPMAVNLRQEVARDSISCRDVECDPCQPFPCLIACSRTFLHSLFCC
jgi:hypothetical protein